MKKTLFLLISIFCIIAIYAQTPVPSGQISGTWTVAGSPYLIEGDVNVPDSAILTIEAGVEVKWQNSYTMHIQGQILALGIETDSVIFTAAIAALGFNGISFIEVPDGNDTSRFEYCIFKYGIAYGTFPKNCGGAIGSIGFSKFIVDHCLFDNNRALNVNSGNPGGGAIALYASSPVIRNSMFINNKSHYGGAIVCDGGSNPLIQRNVFTNNFAYLNAGAIMCSNESNPIIDHNLIFDNSSLEYSGAIEVYFSCSPQIINNTIANNHATYFQGGGLLVSNDCEVLIKNTIFWENTDESGGNQVFIADTTTVLDFYYCDIEGGVADFGGFPFEGIYEENIDELPLFVDAPIGDYHLSKGSPCINTGDPTVFDPDGSRCDIGALCYDPNVGFADILLQKSEISIKCYPNPVLEISNITYSLQFENQVILSIYDIGGKEIRALVNEHQEPGEYMVQFDGADLPAGIYVIKLQAGECVETARLVVVK